MKRLLTTLVILTGLLGSGGAVWADAVDDYNKGVDAYNAGNEAEAVKWYRKAAEQGDAEAQSNLGDLKIKFAQKWIDQCLFDEIEKITGPETKKIVEKHCSQKIENKSVEWLARNVD